MQLGIFAKTFVGCTPSAVLMAVKAAGFSTCQYNMACSGLSAMPEDISNAVISDVAEASLQTGIVLSAVSGTYNMIHPDIAVRKQGQARLEILAAACAGMGINVITLCTGTRNANDQWTDHRDNNTREAWRDLTHSIEAALTMAQRHNIILGIEPEFANVVNSAAKAKQLISEMQSQHLKIIFDAANLFERASQAEQRLIISRALNLLGEHIIIAHAKDRMPNGAFATAGQGCLDYQYYLTALMEIEFDGPLITHGLKPEEAAGIAMFLKQRAAAAGLNII